MATHELSTIISIESSLERSDLPGLFKRACALLEHSGASVVFCDVGNAKADAVTVEALAHLQLAAGRNNCQVKLRNVTAELRVLLVLTGLQDVLDD